MHARACALYSCRSLCLQACHSKVTVMSQVFATPGARPRTQGRQSQVGRRDGSQVPQLRSQPETQASGSRAPSAAGSPQVYRTTSAQLSNLVSSMHSTLLTALRNWMSSIARSEMAMIHPLKHLPLWTQTNFGTEASIFTHTRSN